MRDLDRLALAVVLGALTLAACSERSAPLDPADDDAVARDSLPALIVSEPGPVAGGSAGGDRAEGLTYVSLPPGTLPNAVSVHIRNPIGGTTTGSIPVIEGGFDPVAIRASVGDSLLITVHDSAGANSVLVAFVPKRRPPSVVRTAPAKGRTDVALNVRPAVIFSEPVDTRTVTTSTVSLRRDGSPVSSTVRLIDANGLTAELTPSDSLQGETTYTLIVTAEIRDIDGEQLIEPVTVTFTTVESLTGRIAFASTRDGVSHIYVANADGSGVTRLTGDAQHDREPAWAPDASKIAFTRGGGPETRGIYVMNADGTGLTRLTDGSNNDFDPTWSPDGTRIFFVRSAVELRSALYVINVDGGGLARIFGDVYEYEPALSPDGRRIAFNHVTDLFGTWFTQVYLANADGGGIVRLANSATGEPAECDPAWSPDGSLIAYWSFHHGIAVVSAGGGGNPRSIYGGPTPATRNLPIVFCGSSPDWSPDGRKIVFAKDDGAPGTRRIYIVDVASGVARQLIPNSIGGDDSDPAWSR
jgi:TolB protein